MIGNGLLVIGNGYFFAHIIWPLYGAWSSLLLIFLQNHVVGCQFHPQYNIQIVIYKSIHMDLTPPPFHNLSKRKSVLVYAVFPLMSWLQSCFLLLLF